MGKTILTVDDSLSIRQAVTLTLTAAGYTVLEASGGPAALDLCRGHAVHTILTDLNMPEMDGVELIGRLRALPNLTFTPIVMLTTESNPEHKARGKAAGATGWIVKPFKPDQLLAVVKRVCPP
ncbi:MAG: response regulator [Polyangiaceae bacterium]|jgi:two-component system chemotaxis response regulator CheY